MSRSSLIPGFRFHPTDVELVMYYLKRKLLGKKITVNVVAEVNIYDFSPWDLPDKSPLKNGDLEWYFFCPKARKYTSGGRINRATETGFWKATGKDREVKYKERTVATIKTLIFHLGHGGKGQRTDWVMHEYGMEDKQLASAGIAQDKYVLCRIFEKSGSGPKNGAQYGAPFYEEEWDDDLANCSDSQAIVGTVGASNTTDYKQKDPATTSSTAPGSSIVTFSANEPTNAPNYKQKGLATANTTEPGSSVVIFSLDKPTNTLNYKQKGPATANMTVPGSSTVRFSANEPTNIPNYEQKGPATKNITEPVSSNVMNSANGPTNTLNDKQKGPAAMHMSVPQITHGSSVTEPGTHGLSVTEPGSSSVRLATNEMPANDDVMTSEDFDLIMGVLEGAANEDDHIFDDLINLNNRDGFFTDGLEYTIEELLGPGDPDLRNFYID